MSAEDQVSYSARWIRFVRVPNHAEAFIAAYLDQSGASQNELQRLSREYVTLPPYHNCSCRCPWEARGYPPCAECKRLRAQRVAAADPVAIGRSSVPDSSMPPALMLDLHRAMLVLGRNAAAGAIARWLTDPAA